MRVHYLLVPALIILLSAPAIAGNVTMMNGQVSWESTQCTVPLAPKSLLEADKETMANNMNLYVTQYNVYATLAQTYMDCLSNEAEADATSISQSVIKSAQFKIDAAHTSLKQLAPPQQPKQ